MSTELKHFVLVREKMAGGGRAWREIASFDCRQAADAYAEECYIAHGNPDDYRVSTRGEFQRLDGRGIADENGKRLVYVAIVRDPSSNAFAIGPAYADTFTSELVNALNGDDGALERMRQALREERY